jgi:putative ABC transport system permease protein
VVVVSQSFARAFWPGQDPIGKVLVPANGAPASVVGVARDLKPGSFGGTGPRLYQVRGSIRLGDLLLVRFDGDAHMVEERINAIVRDLDPAMVATPQTLRAILDDWSARFGRIVRLTVYLGAIAIALAMIGIYGVAAYAVKRRTKEFGIRVALGATRRDIVRLVLRSGAKPIGSGFAVGLGLALAGSTGLAIVLRATPVSFSAFDPLAYVAVSALLIVTAFAAMLGPARIAAEANPIAALREE